MLKSGEKLKAGADYSMDYRFGLLHIHPNSLKNLLLDSLSRELVITYQSLPYVFKKEYSLRQVIVRRDSTGEHNVAISQPSRISTDDFFGTGLQKSGSIARGFTIGSNRDMSLSSGFRMQMSGKLSQDLDVVAALTDENSPIQPEGTTQTLREVDKVFIELKNPTYGATLGDFNTEIGRNEGGEFMRLFRKLQGVRGTATFEGPIKEVVKTNFSMMAAASRGKYHTNQFQGVEGSQGPYRLKGKNGESRIIVVAGSERVYVDGEQMIRGEIHDYTIDYSSGEIVFMNRRLITNASRITVDFEYSDRQFTRNLLSGTAGVEMFSGNLNLNAIVVQEADDPESPIDIPLDDASRELLRKSGDDRFKASISGIRFVGRDSTTQAGRGQYILKDTIIAGKNRAVFIYAPGDSMAIYTVSFSQVDQMPPDSLGYTRVGIGQFRFAGLGVGNYLPVQFLPIPQLQRTMDINARAELSPDLVVSGEYAASFLDRNRFSSLDDHDQHGTALKFTTRFNPKHIRLGTTNLGELDLTASERFVDKRFVSPDRFNEIEFNRAWNLQSSSSASEEMREVSIVYRPASQVMLGGYYGSLDRPGQTASRRLRSEFHTTLPTLPTINYQIENVASDGEQGQNSSWLRQKGNIDYLVVGFKPGLGIEAEKRLTTYGGDSLQQGSFRFLQLAPRLALFDLGRLSASAEVQVRTEDSAAAGSLRRAFRALTQIYSWQLDEWQSLTSAFHLSIRNTQFSEEFKARGNANSEVVLVRSVSRYTPFQKAVEMDAYYEFASQRSARLERAFVRVPKGSGNYQYKGDLNGNGIADENEFEQTRFDGDYVVLYVASDQLYPVVDLRTSLRIRLIPARMNPSLGGGLNVVLKAISTETFLRIDERSTEPDAKQIYLLNFRKFQNEGTTIAGLNQLSQDIFLFENSPELSLRFRFSERSGFLQLVAANERSYQNERSVRIRSQLLRELGNQTDYAKKTDRVTSTGPSLRVRDLDIDALNSDFSYRPDLQWEVGFSFAVSRIVDRFTPADATANVNEEAVRLVYGILGSGQARAEIRREEVSISNVVFDPTKPLPFEFTNGKVPGKSYLWRLAFDYRISQNMQVTINYDGRSEGGRDAVHVARAEARAFF